MTEDPDPRSPEQTETFIAFGTPAPDGPQQFDRVGAVWRNKHWILLTAVVVAAITFAICSVLPKSYAAAATVSVSLPPSQAAVSTGQGVTASGDLASQYAQVATLAPVIDKAAKSSGISASELTNSVSAGTINGENLISIRGEAPSPAAAGLRANAVAKALATYIGEQNASQATSYSGAVKNELKPLNKQIAAVTGRINGNSLSRSAQAVAESTLGTLLVQRGELESTVVQNNSSLANASVIARAGSGSIVSPKKKLYTLVALIVAALVAAQLSVTISQRRRSHQV
jgi:capsular polysaccharide biosynthesis protein